MRFAIAAAALAGVVAAGGHHEEAQSTAYSTKYYTITKCPETKTDCPLKSTYVTSSVVPLTTSTIYTTKVYTITSCPPSVPKCPAASTVVVTETEAVSTTVCPVETGHTKYHNTTIPTHTKKPNPEETPCSDDDWTKTKHPHTDKSCGGKSIKTISTSYTTVIPTVIYETVEIPCPTPSKPSATKPGCGSGNCT
jgi:hypothetical protein